MDRARASPRGLFLRELNLVLIPPRNPEGAIVMPEGIARYCRENDLRLGRMVRRRDWGSALRILRRPEFHAGIFPYPAPSDALHTGKCTVAYSVQGRPDEIATVIVDDEAVGRLGARHLIEGGYRNLVFLSRNMDWARARERGFVTEAGRAGLEVAVPRPRRGGPERRYTFGLVKRCAWMHGWLRRLPSPAGVMVCHDAIAEEVLRMALEQGRAVPDEIGVLGVDNNSGQAADLPLSSIELDFSVVGYRAMAMLHALLEGRPLQRQAELVDCGRLIVRRSTDGYVHADPALARAVRFIRERFDEGIGVADVLEDVAISRTALEQRFKRHVGRTPGEEIRRLRLERTRELLAETNLPLADIAARTGFSYPSYLSTAFKKAFGVSPRAFRRNPTR